MPRILSSREHESINVWAITDKQELVVAVLFTSNIKSGFLIKLTQIRSGSELDFQECSTLNISND